MNHYATSFGYQQYDNDICGFNNNSTESIVVPKNSTNEMHSYLNQQSIFSWLNDNFPSAKDVNNTPGNRTYIISSIPIYDKWIRASYEAQLWESYLKIGTTEKSWPEHVIRCTKTSDGFNNTRFITRKINQLSSYIYERSGEITNLQIDLGIYWTPARCSKFKREQLPISIDDSDDDNPEGIRDEIHQLEKSILKYLAHCTKHIKDYIQSLSDLANVEIKQDKALEKFRAVATPSEWYMHLLVEFKMKLFNMKNKKYLAAQKRIEYDIARKIYFNFKIDETIISRDVAQNFYNEMENINQDFRMRVIALYKQTLLQEHESLLNEINNIIKDCSQHGTSNEESLGIIAFKSYYELCLKRKSLEEQRRKSEHTVEKQ